MVACCSRSLNKHERNYSSYRGECLAAVWGCKIYRHFLHGRHFTIVTDHEPLKWLMSSATLEGAHARWACMLQEYDFDIVHRPGVLNNNADALSTMPLPMTLLCNVQYFRTHLTTQRSMQELPRAYLMYWVLTTLPT